MAKEDKKGFSFDWGRALESDTELRDHEMADRLLWFISMRWIAGAMCLLGSAAAVLHLIPAAIDPVYFLAASGLLIVSNLIYFVLGKSAARQGPDAKKIGVILFVQMMTDYMVLSLITYACGTIELPILILYMPHVILSTLFFPRKVNLLVTFIGLCAASLPMILERAGVIPIMSVLPSSFKQHLIGSWPLTGAFIVFIGGGFFVTWYLVSEIATSLKQREKQLESAHKMLIEIDREKTLGSLRATHELKAPFAAIKSYVYTLRDGYCGPLPEKAKQVVDRIGIRCDRLTDKISDIIHLSNLKTLVFQPGDMEDVDLAEIVRQETEEADLLGRPRGVMASNLAKDHPPAYVRGSANHLRTMLSNLLSNAVNYSNDDGAVEVSMRTAPGSVSVRVLDHGIGIPKENIPKIFEEHFRSNNAVKHNPNGNGLGLPMVKEIVRLHGAVLRVASEVGKGTRFTVTFNTSR